MPAMPIRIGLLGAARITPLAVIIPIRDHPDLGSALEISAVAARDPKRARDFAQTHAIPTIYETNSELIEAPDIDLIYNALPINLHAEWTIKAAEAGKSVLCEKPFAMNMDEARAMIAAGQAHTVRVIEAFHHRYHPAFAQCLAWAQTGRIGKIRSIDAEFSVPIPDTGHEIRHQIETGGGAMMDLGCYPLNWALSLIDSAPVSITAQADLTPKGVDETLQATLNFPDGVSAHIRTSMAPKQDLVRRLVIQGETGRIDFDNPLAPHQGACLDLIQAGEIIISTAIDPRSTYFHQLSAVAHALNSGDPLPTEGTATLRQQQVIDDIYAAAGLAHLRSPSARPHAG